MGHQCTRRGALTLSFVLSAACSGGGAGGDAALSGDSAAVTDVAAPTDSAVPADGATPTSAALVQMCRMVHACGYTTARFRVAGDTCLETALAAVAAGAETDSPEQRAHFVRMAQCAARTTTCDAFVRCADFDTPCSGSATASCSGNVAVRCSTPGGNYLPRVMDCAAVGQTCMNGVCALAAGPNECDNPGGVRCDGAVRVWCRPRVGGGGGEVREPCPTGTTCLASGSGASCVAVRSCGAPEARCDGNTAVVCSMATGPDGMRGLYEQRLDCAAAGRRCMVDARGRPACVPMASGCMVPPPNSPSLSTCEGANVSVCLDGNPTRIDCAAVGRMPCRMITPPAGLGTPYAGCGT